MYLFEMMGTLIYVPLRKYSVIERVYVKGGHVN